MKKILAFDMDDTLTVAKTPVSNQMVGLLVDLLDYFDVCVVSGASYEQIKLQVVDRLKLNDSKLKRLHLLPTCGTRYYRYDKKWMLQYSQDLSKEDKKRIIRALESSAKELGYWPKNPTGNIIEDRESQITFAGLGSSAKSEDKYKWDPDGKKRTAIREIMSKHIPDFEARVDGTTSIDVTKLGINKGYGISKLLEALGLNKNDILFFGDRLEEGGNDYPVKALGVDVIEVKGWEDTAARIETILADVRQ